MSHLVPVVVERSHLPASEAGSGVGIGAGIGIGGGVEAEAGRGRGEAGGFVGGAAPGREVGSAAGAGRRAQALHRLAGGGLAPVSVERILERVSRRVGAEGFERYFRHQTRVTLANGRLDVAVPTGFVAEVIGRRFGATLIEAAAEELREAGAPEGGLEVRFRVDGSAFAGGAVASANATAAKGADAVMDAARGVMRHSEQGRAPAGSPTAVGGGVGGVGRTVRPGVAGIVGGRGMAARLRLEDFIVGGSNRLAHTAALRLCEADCPRGFSPLLIHGESGVGKTHLLQGVARRMAEVRPGSRVVYTTAEAFTNEYITAVRERKVDEFRRAYRGVDLLCLDDVHFLSSKEGTQQELLHTFDAVDLAGGRVALASDEHPRSIAAFSKHLVSRFMAGMVVRVEAPDAELRERIVVALAAKRGLRLEPAAARMLATHGVGAGGGGASVRDLEGELTRVEAQASVSPALVGEGGVIGLNAVRAALGLLEAMGSSGRVGGVARPVRADEIVAVVCRTLRVEMSELIGRGRHPRVVLARGAVAWLARSLTTMSFPEIARVIGRPSHSTVVTAFQRISSQATGGAAATLGGDGSAAPELRGMTVMEVLERMRAEVVKGR